MSLEDEQNIVVQKLTDLNAAVTRAKTERIRKEAAYNQIRTLQNDRAALDTFPAILSNTFIQQQKRDALALNRKGIEYGALARDAASNRQIDATPKT